MKFENPMDIICTYIAHFWTLNEVKEGITQNSNTTTDKEEEVKVWDLI